MNPSSPTWRMWTAERIVEELPGLLTKVERHREAFPEEYQEKNREAVDALRTSPPTLAEIREKTRRQELSTLGFALDLLARRVISEQEVEERLNLFQAAHELFRSVNIAPHHSKPMRQVVTDALQVVLNSEVARIKAGETDAGVVHEAIKALVLSAWDYIPPQLALSINGQLLIELERIRAEGENDGAFDEQKLIRDNIEAVAALEVPQQLAAIQDRWLDIANHVAPVAGRVVTRWRPKTLPDLLSLDVWEQIKQAVGQGDVSALEQTLAGVADDLETNLRLRLDAQAEYRLPISEVRYRQGGPHRDFVAARELLSQQDKQALEKFSALHFHMSNNTFVKEWYAYALTRFGAAGDIHEIIQLLSDAIESPYYRLEKQWTARWNLACALRRLPNRKDQALDALLPVLESDSHSTEAFELCLLWAFEQDREKVLADLLPKSPYYEAHLLAALYAIEQRAQEEEGDDFPDHFRRINRILRNPAHIFPHPTDPLQFSQLDQLTREFVETSMVEAGIEWFRQRVSYEKEYYIFKNWECAAELNDRAGDKAAAWHCYQRLWGCTQSKQNLSPTAKKRVLENILTWAQQNDFEEQAVVMLRQNWQKTAMTENDALLWEARLRITPPPQPPIIIDGITLKPRRSFDEIIQELAGSFEEVAIPDALAKREQDIQQFLEAVRLKRPDTSAAVLGAIREVVRLAAIYTEGVDDQQARKLAEQMRDQLGPLRSQGEKLPFELRGLVRACERAISNMSARVTGAPEIMVSLPEASRAALGRPEPGETYTTRVLIQLSNPSEEVMGEIDMGFIVVSSGVSLQEESIKLDRISPKEKQVVECTLHMNDGVEDEIALRVHVTYKIRGMMGRPAQGMWHIPVRPFGEPIPVTQRYTTGAPVTADRDDLFHGRDEEMARLLAAFEGGQMRRLYFVNGIRRVGKSTLMAQLGGRSNRETLPLLLNLEDALRGREITTVQLVRQLIRTSIDQLQGRRGLPRIFLELPGAEQFALDPPWTVFDNFLKELCNQTKRHHILLCFDEVQWLVKRIGDPNDPLDDGFLSWLRSKIQTGSNIFVVCTGSEAYEEMRKSCPRHPVWGNMEAFNISFVSRAAMDKIATLPVKTDGVVWLSEALDRLWDMTEGHPWLTQILAEKVAERLNKERRRLVGPGDINRAAEQAAADSRIGDLWWNESEGLVTETHRQIAYLLLRQQPGSRVGLPETQLVDLCQNRLGIH
ncbi:MAG TPA: hypothetical protein VFU32_09005, partial [Ktedonobacterales bacterium]|nr:hypothetical protein [Ktedonobacterales bacterium]